MAFLGLASVLLFFISLIITINPKWLSRGNFVLTRKRGALILLLSFVGFISAFTLDKPTGTSSQQATISTVQNEEQPKTEEEQTKIQIEDAIIKRVTDDVKKRDFVKDAAITVDKDRVSLAVIVGYAVNKETAKRIGDNFVRTLGAAAGGKFPEKDYYGEVYDHYDLIITVATPDETIISTGAKVTYAPSIKWDS
ncbi:hypothetical protein [Brevibacillus laterosporus]|uniref:Uncharacterized protein n=1 Tax=Brevibacillus laterosporus TaxID=1465 RepID=A0AAP3DHK3_BRELA|nr:hypothetical protein [Brevibacillus laterosporus]MCR8981484.1 hypothetical protein [Brevibacillus laterosporus]MCZ0808639.1 hypothetical protein [Brevibacillus laterosporus]